MPRNYEFSKDDKYMCFTINVHQNNLTPLITVPIHGENHLQVFFFWKNFALLRKISNTI